MTQQLNQDLNSTNPFVRDKAMNELARQYFSMEHGQEIKDLMFYSLTTLLLEKEIISQEELTAKVEEATTFYKILKRRSEEVANRES